MFSDEAVGSADEAEEIFMGGTYYLIVGASCVVEAPKAAPGI
jgi:hypothetical protein